MPHFTAFFDDSGTSPSNEVACSAGFVFEAEGGNEFELSWEQARSIPGDGFSVMHMAECVSGNKKSEFHDWDLPKKQRVLGRLRDITKKHAVRAFGLAINKNDYESMVPEAQKRKVGSHFTFTTLCHMNMVGQWRQRSNLVEPVNYVFSWMEPGDTKRAELELVLKRELDQGSALRHYGLIENGYSFLDMRAVPELQAADIAAWALYNATLHSMDIKKVNLIAEETYNDFARHNRTLWADFGFFSPEQVADYARQAASSEAMAALADITPGSPK